MKLRTHLTSALLALVLLFSLSVPALAQEPTREEAALAAATAAMQYGYADSIQYAVWEEGKITLSGHAGTYSRTENRALTADNLYGIGSVSKVYTTAAVMKLVQQGRISLDAPVTRYLPSFKMADERYKQITVRMLLNHSSGIMGTSSQNAFLYADDDRSATEDLLERLATQRLKAAPGAYSVYCNDGFTLAELVVEAVSGQSFPAFLRSSLLQPNGLKATFAPQDKFDTSLLAKTYLTVEDTRPLAQDCLGIVGTGGLYSTASDLAAFGGLLTGNDYLSSSSRQAMANEEYARGLWPSDTDDAVSYGLGWDSVQFFPFSQTDIQALVKGGDTTQYHAGLVVLPEYKMAAAVLSSGGVSLYNEMAAVQMLAATLKAKGVAVDETIPTLPAATPASMPAGLTKLSGYYAATAVQLKVDISTDGKLSMSSLSYPSAPAQEFTYYSDGSFRDVTGATMVKLVTEKNGQTYFYQKAYSPLPGLGVMPTSNYAAVRVAENPIDSATQAAWDKLNASGWLLVSEKASSQLWPQALATAAETPKTIPGYMGAARITGDTQALYELQIPGTGGRDGQDYQLETRNNVNYLTIGNAVFAESTILRPISGGASSYCTIREDGYARWYATGKYSGYTLSVTLPENGGFTVYNAKGVATASSAAWGDKTAVLPKDGYVVFAGDAGDRFQLSFTAPKA